MQIRQNDQSKRLHHKDAHKDTRDKSRDVEEHTAKDETDEVIECDAYKDVAAVGQQIQYGRIKRIQ